MIRLHSLCSLIFFVFIFPACNQSKHTDVTVIWNNNHAVAISIPKGLLNSVSIDSINNFLKVRVEKSSDIAMLGEYISRDDEIIFKPVVPLTRGLSYEIFYRDKLIANPKVPLASIAESLVLEAIYPTHDTLPENLLKIYLQFSHPMQEGESEKHITLLDHNNDTLHGVFLNLQPELWNKERTILTIWLDPGRIKRDLIPNQKLGNPLRKGEQYTLSISANWKDAGGLALQQSYTKQFVVGARDSLSPNIEKWILKLPSAQTKETLEINFGEPLDYFLLQETIRIVDENNDNVTGKIAVTDRERKLEFIPTNKWQSGHYRLQVEAILEDLAGNNFNKPFDRDVRVKNMNLDKTMFERAFEVKK